MKVKNNLRLHQKIKTWYLHFKQEELRYGSHGRELVLLISILQNEIVLAPESTETMEKGKYERFIACPCVVYIRLQQKCPSLNVFSKPRIFYDTEWLPANILIIMLCLGRALNDHLFAILTWIMTAEKG